VNLSVKKLRRSATIIGGTFLGLGIAAAMATPALACYPEITDVSSCVNADGTWVINWSVAPTDTGVAGTIDKVDFSPASSTLTGIIVGAPLPVGVPLTGVQTIPADQGLAGIEVSAKFDNGVYSTRASGWKAKPTEVCETQPSSPAPSSSTPPTTPPTTSASPSPSASTPVSDLQFIYHETCTTFTVGVQVPKDWPNSVTTTFTPSVGTAKTVTAKPGETKTVDFPASKNLTITSTSKGYPKYDSSITYKAPANCTSAAPSTAPAALPITGSSSGPLAAGAVALVLLGGGAIYLTRRRKMKFSA
jgi:LPXTG-motif cell wall-anchored protein